MGALPKPNHNSSGQTIETATHCIGVMLYKFSKIMKFCVFYASTQFESNLYATFCEINRISKNFKSPKILSFTFTSTAYYITGRLRGLCCSLL